MKNKPVKAVKCYILLIIHSAILIFMLLSALYINLYELPLENYSIHCYFKDSLRLYCPGCGGTRAFLSFFKFNLIDSFMSNPLVIYFFLLFIHFYLKNIYHLLTGKYHAKLFTPFLAHCVVIMFLVVFIGRNLLLTAFHYDYLGDLIKIYN